MLAALWLALSMALAAPSLPPSVESAFARLEALPDRSDPRRHRQVLGLVSLALQDGGVEQVMPVFWDQLERVPPDAALLEVFGRFSALACLEDDDDRTYEICARWLERAQVPAVERDTWVHVLLALHFRANTFDQLQRIVPLFARAEALLRGQKDHVELLARLLRHRSEVEHSLGHQAMALKYARRATLEALRLDAPFERQAARLTLASQVVWLGAPERALRVSRDVQIWFEENGQLDLVGRSKVVEVQALAALGQLDVETVHATYAYVEKAYQDKLYGGLEARLSLAEALYRIGAFEACYELLNQIDLARVTDRYRGRADIRYLRARASVGRGDAQGALRDAREAVRGYAVALPADHVRNAQARLLLLSLEEEPDHLSVVETLDALARRLEVLGELGPTESMQYAEELHADLATYLRLADADDEVAYRLLLRIKGVASAQETRRMQVLRSQGMTLDEQALQFLYVFRQARSALALGADLYGENIAIGEQLYMTYAGEAEVYRQLLDAGRIELPPPATTRQLQAALPPDGALLDLAVLDGELVCFVVRPDSLVRVDMGPVADIEASSLRLTRKLAAGVPLSVLQPAAQELSRLALLPLWEALQGVRQVYLCPEGRVAFVPWGMLPLPDGSLLLESVRLTQVPWAGLLVREAQPANPYRAHLVMGDADFGTQDPEEPGCAGRNWSPLPASGREVRAVRRALNGPVALLQGAEATEAAFRQLAPFASIIHLATHGFFGEAGCAGADVTVEAQMRQGLVFAGANTLPRTPSDVDGLVSAAEMTLLDLRGTELVVLSACETGLGEAVVGEGVEGLRKAILHAGAQQLVSSLWPVPDGPTSELMRRFYRELRRHPPAEALRRSQVWMMQRNQRKYGETRPRDWAAWVISGVETGRAGTVDGAWVSHSPRGG